MPLYVYKCEGCGHEFEDLISYAKRDDVKPCPKCKTGSKRKEVTEFGFSVKADKGATIISPKEIDKAVGADADRRWNYIEARKNKRHDGWRRGGLKEMEISSAKDKDGTFKPVGVLGDSKIRGLRKVYSDALAEHRAARQKRGEGQFEGPGAIDDSPEERKATQ